MQFALVYSGLCPDQMMQSNLPELEFEFVVVANGHLGAGSQSQVFYKSHKLS